MYKRKNSSIKLYRDSLCLVIYLDNQEKKDAAFTFTFVYVFSMLV